MEMYTVYKKVDGVFVYQSNMTPDEVIAQYKELMKTDLYLFSPERNAWFQVQESFFHVNGTPIPFDFTRVFDARAT
jgi:hypothetical protein